MLHVFTRLFVFLTSNALNVPSICFDSFDDGDFDDGEEDEGLDDLENAEDVSS